MSSFANRSLLLLHLSEFRQSLAKATSSRIPDLISKHCLHAGAADVSDPQISRYLDSLPNQFDKIREALYPSAKENPANATPSESIKMQYIRLQKAMPAIQKRLQKLSDTSELQNMSAELKTTGDTEMLKLAQEDIQKCTQEVQNLEQEILETLVPEEAEDAGDILVEVNAGVGGQEAMLFASELFRMYERYALFRGWNFEELEYDKSDIGGIRSACAAISGNEVYKHLKFEGGVHRVQRVPKTEKFGRVHTSTVTVTVLSKPKNVDVVINKNDLRIETCRSSAKGGQNVNKLETAVRIVHIPTNTAVECQEERSQLQNRERAMDKLAALLFQKQLDACNEQVAASRKLQVTSCDRSDKIRTYNFAQNRLTDHRIGLNLHNLEEILQGKDSFDDLIRETCAEYQRESVEQLIKSALNEPGGSAVQETRSGVKSY